LIHGKVEQTFDQSSQILFFPDDQDWDWSSATDLHCNRPMPARSALPAQRLIPAIFYIVVLVLGGSPAAARPCTPNATTPSNDTSANGTSVVVLATNATAGGNASNSTVVVEGGGWADMSDEEKRNAQAAAAKAKADAAAAASASAAAKAAIVTDPVSAKMVCMSHP